jgi:hypothetical protein
MPNVHTPEEWPQVIGEMAARSRLTPEERQDVERFLVALSAGDAAARGTGAR